jgi:NADP-dependent 3-hydroxy acid dehydrogenase YdfG
VVRSESPKVHFSTLALAGDPKAMNIRALAAPILGQAGRGENLVNYRWTADDKQLFAERLTATSLPQSSVQPLPPGSVVVISGGAGGIGRLIARFLVHRGCRVALFGRSPQQAVALSLQAQGLADTPHCRYYQADVTHVDQVSEVIAQVRQGWGPIHAVFHAAGVPSGGMILRKDLQLAQENMAAKVLGALVLDEATQQDSLRHFITFSSLASYLGPVGQSEYAYANAFLNSFAVARNERDPKGPHKGPSCSINWPLWQEGGMNLSAADRAYMEHHHGMDTMMTRTAMTALLAILGSSQETVALAVGDPEKIHRSLLGDTRGRLSRRFIINHNF